MIEVTRTELPDEATPENPIIDNPGKPTTPEKSPENGKPDPRRVDSLGRLGNQCLRYFPVWPELSFRKLHLEPHERLACGGLGGVA